MQPGDAGAAVEVRDLRVDLPSGDDIVDEISFAVRPGRIFGLVGESGSGKTTVGLALLRHARNGARLAHGSIAVGDQQLTTMSDGQVRRLRGGTVAYIPQDPGAALNPAMRIGSQLSEMLDAHTSMAAADRQNRLRETLADVALPDDPAFLRRYPHQLSGGQQQRVAIAMAFICRPRVIICDEPTTALDVTTQAHILQTIRRLCSLHEVAVVYISHDLAVVAELADDVAVMYAGRIVEQAPCDQLFARPRHPYTVGLLNAIPDLGSARGLIGISGRAPLPGRRPAGCFFAPRCPLASEVCTNRFPAAIQVGSAHDVRCHHHAEVVATPIIEVSATPPATDKVLLRADAIDARHGKAQVLFEAGVTISGNECVALVGESGSGKTTLARCIVGLHRDFAGTLTLDDAPLAPSARDRPADVLRRVQYIFQNPYASLNPRHTVGHAIARRLALFSIGQKSEIPERVAAALESVGLSSSLINRFPDRLSGGERQRVAIARALVVEPEVLICDQITSALDVSVQAAIVELIGRLRRETGMSLLFITHNLALVKNIADRVVVMAAGRIVETGATTEVLSHPAAAYTARLLQDTPTATPRALAVPDQEPRATAQSTP